MKTGPETGSLEVGAPKNERGQAFDGRKTDNDLTL